MQIELQFIGYVSDILRTKNEVQEDKEHTSTVLDLGRWFGMNPNCIPTKDMMDGIPQKSNVNEKLLVERAVFGLIYIVTSRCDDWGKVYHILILGGVIFYVFFIGKWNQELFHTIFQEYPQRAKNLAQQNYGILKSLRNIA